MASGNFSSKSYSGLCLYVEWSSTSNINSNTSSVTAKVYVKSYGLRASALSDSYVTINGNKKSWTHTFNISDTSILQTTKVAEYTVSVPHNSDGTKSITIKANMEFNGTYGGTYISDLTASKTVTLDTIPRSSSFSIPSSVNTGSSLTATITPSSSTFKHKIRLEIGGTTKHTSSFIAAGTTSYSYTIPHSWLPSSTSETMTVYLYTYTSSATEDTDYIARISKTITVNVPSSVKPSISELTASVSSGLSGKYIQGKSKVKLTASASAGSGSSISSYIFKGTNINGSSSSYTVSSTNTSYTKTSSTIQTSGTLTYKVAVTDKRGRTSDYSTVSITVYSYAAPQITSISAQRCLQDGTVDKNGTYAKVTVKRSYSSIDGANTRTVKLYSSKDDYASGTTVLSTSNTSNTYTGVYSSGFAASTNYTIQAVIEDAYNTHSKSASLSVAERTLNIAKYGNGVAVGGLSSITSASSSGKFECNWDADFTGDIRINSTSSRYIEINRSGVPDDVNQDGTDETADIRMQFYIGDSGNVTCRRRYMLSGDTGYTTQGYWQLGDSRMYISYPLQVNGTVSAYRGRFTATTDASETAQNDVPLRIGNADSGHMDVDENEIIAKASPTTLAPIHIIGSTVSFWCGDTKALYIYEDGTSKCVRSEITYSRTYAGSPNMFITQNGVFGRGTSSSMRYKIDIEDVHDENLNPYKILDIPVRQYKYNADNIPINKKADDVYVGFIAEEVAEAYPVAAEYNEDGQVEMWNIKVMVPAMLKIIQDQQKEINELKAKVEELDMNK